MNERLERGVQYSLQGWIPINESVLGDIKARLSEGSYGTDAAHLMRDLRKDPSLTLLTLRKLAEAKPSNAQTPLSPHEFKTAQQFAQLESALHSTSTVVSSHRISAASAEQSHCLIRGVIAANVTEQLAAPEDLPAGLAYSTAALRHLGHLLISWNYPHLYQKVLKELGPETSIDQAFGSILGFSPTLLAVTIAQKWQIAPDILAAMGDRSAAASLPPELSQRAKELEQLCKVGEALARSMYPEEFPSAQTDWNDASTFIRKKLGPEGLKTILQATKLYVKNFAASLPSAFSVPENLEGDALPSTSSPSAASRNRYLENCPAGLRQQLENIYSLLQGSGISREPLELLVKKAIPSAGFVRGCVYLLDPDSLVLQPRVAIGSLAINRVAPHKFSALLPEGSRSVIAAALTSTVPQETDCSVLDQSAQAAIAGALGIEQKTGVLYLEAGDALSSRPAQERLLLFKALRQTLNDVLQLS